MPQHPTTLEASSESEPSHESPAPLNLGLALRRLCPTSWYPSAPEFPVRSTEASLSTDEAGIRQLRSEGQSLVYSTAKTPREGSCAPLHIVHEACDRGTTEDKQRNKRGTAEERQSND